MKRAGLLREKRTKEWVKSPKQQKMSLKKGRIMQDFGTLAELVDISELTRIQDSLAKALGFAAVITDPEGRPITVPSNFSKACHEFHRPLGNGRCEDSDRTLGQESLHSNAAVIRCCDHAGLMDAAVAILLDERPIGAFLCGQVFFEPPDYEECKQKAKEWGIDEKAYLEAISEIPVIPRERFEAGVELMRLSAEMLAKMGKKNLEQKRAIAGLEEAEKALEEERSYWRMLFDEAPLGVVVYDLDGRYADVNKDFCSLAGMTKEELLDPAFDWKELFRDCLQETMERVRRVSETGETVVGELVIAGKKKRTNVLSTTVDLPWKDLKGRPLQAAFHQDITPLKQAQEKLQELVEAQQRTIKELSTPVIPVWSRVIMAPLLGSFDSMRMHDLSERLLQEVASQKPRAVLLDLSGLAYVDTQVVSEVVRLIASVRILGTRTVLSGIGPHVAQSLVRLGANLEGIPTYATLEQALRSVAGGGGEWRTITGEKSIVHRPWSCGTLSREGRKKRPLVGLRTNGENRKKKAKEPPKSLRESNRSPCLKPFSGGGALPC